jgi:hypothetical protein
MRYLLIVVSSVFLLTLTPAPAQAQAQISIGINTPGVSIGINMPGYPRLVRVPGYPVYYDPYVDANYFFYDGLYWVFYSNSWYASSWYNGPWQLVNPYEVPLFILRIPVRYYRRPPAFFHGWRADQPPRWGVHWGHEWERHHKNWNRWDRKSTPPPAPLPRYQKKYTGKQYPGARVKQRPIRTEKYRYQPREPVTRQYYRGVRTDQRQIRVKDRNKNMNKNQDQKKKRDDRDQKRR